MIRIALLLLFLAAAGCGSETVVVDSGANSVPAASFRSQDLGITAEVPADVLVRGEDTLLVTRRTGFEGRAVELLRTNALLQELQIRQNGNVRSLASHRLVEVQLSGQGDALLRLRPSGVRAAILENGQPLYSSYGPGERRPTANPSPSPLFGVTIVGVAGTGQTPPPSGPLTDFNLTFANGLTTLTMNGDPPVIVRLTNPAATTVGVSETVTYNSGSETLSYQLSGVTLVGSASTSVTWSAQYCLGSNGVSYGTPPPTN